MHYESNIKSKLIEFGDITLRKEWRKEKSYSIQSESFNYHGSDQPFSIDQRKGKDGKNYFDVKRILIIQMN